MTSVIAAGIEAAAGGSRGPGFAALRRLRHEAPAKALQNRPPATTLKRIARQAAQNQNKCNFAGIKNNYHEHIS